MDLKLHITSPFGKNRLFKSVWQFLCKKLYHLKNVGANLLNVLENKVVREQPKCTMLISKKIFKKSKFSTLLQVEVQLSKTENENSCYPSSKTLMCFFLLTSIHDETVQ